MTRDETSPLGRLGIPAGILPLAGLLLAGLATIGLFTWDSITGMVAIWTRVSAYNHCWLVLPIAGYLAWARRGRLTGLSAKPFWPGLIVVVGFASAWMLARGAAIAEGEQVAVVGMVQGFLLTVLGPRICRAQILPILYLWLLVPTGGFLIPTLQTVATWQSTQLLALTPIPFFVEEHLVQLPVGLFFVAPGCSGLNFLLASLALSVVYADIMFRSWRRKLACILIALAAAIIANGLRIFIIFALAELSEQKLEIVDDHLLYGWGFFLVILLALMWIGRFFSDWEPLPDTTLSGDSASAHAGHQAASAGTALGRPVVVATALAVMLSGAIITYARAAFAQGTAKTGLQIEMPQAIGGWTMTGTLELWDGAFPNADFATMWRFQKGSAFVDVLVGYYWDQWEGHEAATSYNYATGPQSAQTVGRKQVAVTLNGRPYESAERISRERQHNWRTWQWYCVGGKFTSSALAARLQTALSELAFGDGSAASFTLLTTDGGDARGNLRDFATALGAELGTLEVSESEGGITRNIACW